MTEYGVIALSGGIDSAVTLAWAVAAGFEMHSIFFNYGQPSVHAERDHAVFVSNRYGACQYDEINLFPEMKPFPGKDNFEYPVRNLLFISALGAIASVRQRPHIFIGINSAAGQESIDCDYSDCTSEFIESAELALKFCNEDLQLHTPLLSVPKSGVLGLAAALGVDISHTFSCLNPHADFNPCDVCVSCVERLKAIKLHSG